MRRKRAKYKIELTERQLMLYAEALENYSRLLAGQVRYALPAKLEFKALNGNARRDVMEKLSELKKLLFPELTEHMAYGIGWTDDKMRQDMQITYEMYREVLHYKQKEYERKILYSNKPLKHSGNAYTSPTPHESNQTLPVVKKLEDK